MTLTLALAQKVAAAALKAAEQQAQTVTVAVVDAAGTPVFLARMDGAPIPTVDITEGKAYTAATLGTTTDQLQALTAPGGPLWGLAGATFTSRPVVVLPGGAPLTIDGDHVGGIGVGGADTPTLDQTIASHAAESISNFGY